MLRYLILLGLLTAIPLQGYAAAQVEKPAATQAAPRQTEGPVWVVEAVKTETGQGPVWVVQAMKTSKVAG